MTNEIAKMLMDAMDSLPPVGSTRKDGKAWLGSKTAEIRNGKAVAWVDTWYKIST